MSQDYIIFKLKEFKGIRQTRRKVRETVGETEEAVEDETEGS